MTAEPLELFYSYAHKDASLRAKMDTHLAALRNQGFIKQWHDGEILPGSMWAKDIDHHLRSPHIILLLISSDFLASEYCYSIEMKEAIRRHEAKEAIVIPVLLRPCDWETALLARYKHYS